MNMFLLIIAVIIASSVGVTVTVLITKEKDDEI